MFVDWEHDFIDADDPVPVQVAGAEAFAERAGELGVGDGDLVVTYDDYYGIFAARVAWAFRYYGAEARVLDGGWSTWLEEGRPVSDETVEPDARAVHRAPEAAAAADARRGTGGAGPRRDAGGRPAAPSVPRRAGRREHGAHPRRRAACPTRSWSTARPGCGPRRRRSPGSRATPGSTPTARRGS